MKYLFTSCGWSPNIGTHKNICFVVAVKYNVHDTVCVCVCACAPVCPHLSWYTYEHQMSLHVYFPGPREINGRFYEWTFILVTGYNKEKIQVTSRCLGVLIKKKDRCKIAFGILISIAERMCVCVRACVRALCLKFFAA